MVTRVVSRFSRRLLVALFTSVAMLASACGGGSEPTVDNTPASISLSPGGTLTVASGTSSTVSATVKTKSGTVISTATVTWTSSDPTIATVLGGTITGAKQGAATITATAGTLTAQVAVSVTPGASTQLVIRTQPVGSSVGTPLATQPVIEFRDGAGNLTASNSPVTVSISSGGGTLSGTTTVTATSGVATFTNLAISGAAGPRTLTFVAAGLTPATSAEFTITAPPFPVLVVDTSAFTIAMTTGSTPATRTVTITNGGGVDFSAVTIDPVVYDAGQPTGWLTPTITGAVPPFKLALALSTSTLTVGTYHASVRINSPGASNTPVTISVTLNVSPTINITYGAAGEKTRLLDPGTTFAPTVSATVDKVPQPVSAIAFTSRATSVVTVDATGKLTAVGPGQSWVVATLQGAGDSVFVSVTRSAAGPVLRADLSTWVFHPGDTLLVSFTLDPRTTPVAGTTAVIGYETQNNMFTVLGASIPDQSPMPTGSGTSPGVIKISVASANALTGPIVMVQLRLVARSAGLSGFLTFTALDIVGPDGTDQSLKTTSTRYPVVIR